MSNSYNIQDYIHIANIVKPHGIKGFCCIYSEFAEDMLEIFQRDGKITLLVYINSSNNNNFNNQQFTPENCEILTVEKISPHKKFLLTKFVETNSINELERHLKQKLFLLREKIYVANDEFLVSQLLDCQIYLCRNNNCDDENSIHPVGRVTSVDNYGAGDVIEVQFYESNEKELFSFSEKTFPKIDINANKIYFNPPDYL